MNLEKKKKIINYATYFAKNFLSKSNFFNGIARVIREIWMNIYK